MPSISCGVAFVHYKSIECIEFQDAQTLKENHNGLRLYIIWLHSYHHQSHFLSSKLLTISKMNCQQCLRFWHCHHSQRLLMEDWIIVAINFLGTEHMIMPHCQGCRRWLTILNNIWSGIFWTTGGDVGHLVRWQELGAVSDHEQLDFFRASSFKPCPTSVDRAHCADCTEKLSPLDQ